MHLRFSGVVGWALGLCCSIGSVAAQEPAGAQQEAGSSDEFLHVDQIITQAVRNIGVRYNLNDEQIRLTDEIMRRDVHAFLREHREKVWPVLRELMRYQLGGEVPPADAAKRIGAAAQPLLGMAFKAIIEGNEEWRDCLTDAQKAVHDWDMEEMRRQFEVIEENVAEWKAGHPSQHGILPTVSKKAQPPRPPKPPAGLPVPAGSVVSLDERLFAALVDLFIEENELDPPQKQAALSILEEMKQKAQAYLESKKKELTELRAKEVEAGRLPVDWEKYKEAQAQRRELQKPVAVGMTNELKLRLVKLLTSEQLARYCQRHPDHEGVCSGARPTALPADAQAEAAKAEASRKKDDADARSRRGKGKKDKGDKPADGETPAPKPAPESDNG
ncbi:MAG: hypothetical protein C4547_16825 [Phycisphaerales bacterium]|nr:MAG: hypothetical protein C4547_16825 [Phycisphaerales bacterium]